MISVFALAIACLIPLLFLIIVYQLDLYKTGNYGNIAMALGGGIMAYWAAFLINPWMRNHGLVSGDVMVRFSAPVLEEILKGLILLFLVRRASFTYFVDGAIYGFAAGIGFAIFENVEYINGNPGAALSLDRKSVV